MGDPSRDGFDFRCIRSMLVLRSTVIISRTGTTQELMSSWWKRMRIMGWMRKYGRPTLCLRQMRHWLWRLQAMTPGGLASVPTNTQMIGIQPYPVGLESGYLLLPVIPPGDLITDHLARFICGNLYIWWYVKVWAWDETGTLSRFRNVCIFGRVETSVSAVSGYDSTGD